MTAEGSREAQRLEDDEGRMCYSLSRSQASVLFDEGRSDDSRMAYQTKGKS